MQRSDFRHFIDLPIRWGDMDALAHVNNVQFFRYLESGRIAYIDDLFPGQRTSDNVVLADLQCSFLRQLHYPGVVHVGTRVSRIGRSSLQLRCGIFTNSDERPSATAQAVIVWFDFATQSTAPLPQTVREAIIAKEIVPPELV